MSRPQSLREVSSVVIAGTKPFGYAIDEFIDTFYLDHPDRLRQQQRIDDAPPIVGDAFVDSWIGAVGEHLARRWDLAVPAWTRRPAHYALSLPPVRSGFEGLAPHAARREPARLQVAPALYVRRTIAARKVSARREAYRAAGMSLAVRYDLCFS
jgi:hypothetical protein